MVLCLHLEPNSGCNLLSYRHSFSKGAETEDNSDVARLTRTDNFLPQIVSRLVAWLYTLSASFPNEEGRHRCQQQLQPKWINAF